MRKRVRKTAFLTVKVLVAVVLLLWVLSQVHWRNFVVDTDGQSWAVLDGPITVEGETAFRVQRGMPWARQTARLRPQDLKPVEVDGREVYVRDGFRSALVKVNKGLLAAGAVCFLLNFLLCAARWRGLLAVQEIRISYWQAFRLTILGLFFNQVVPGTVGGDLVKVYYVSRHTSRKAAALVSMFVDRMMGLTELTLLAAVMLTVVLAAGLETLERMKAPAISLAVVVCIVAGGLLFLLSRRFRGALHLQRLYRRLPIAHHLAAAGDAADLYRKHYGALVQAVAITLAAHVLWIGGILLLGWSLGLAAPAYRYFVYVPLIYIIGAAPVSIGGLGLVEGLYQYYFASANASAVLALALLARLIPVLWSLPGIVFAVTGPKLPKAETIEQELAAADAEN